jgi:hypothetical protein
MSDYLLTPKEQLRFSIYCRIQAEACEGMAKQMAKMSGEAMQELVRREKAKAAAFRVVARTLEIDTEEHQVSAEDVGDAADLTQPEESR